MRARTRWASNHHAYLGPRTTTCIALPISAQHTFSKQCLLRSELLSSGSDILRINAASLLPTSKRFTLYTVPSHNHNSQSSLFTVLLCRDYTARQQAASCTLIALCLRFTPAPAEGATTSPEFYRTIAEQAI